MACAAIETEQDRIVVMGAGALSLGFLGPELTRDYALTLVDTSAKADLVEGLRRCGEYTFNLAGETIERVTVGNVVAHNLEDQGDAASIASDIAEARLFFTAVGIRYLDAALGFLAGHLKERRDEAFVFCAENGEHIAEGWRERLPGNIHICDTVMGRMCRMEEHPGDEYAPVMPSLNWGVVAEDFYGIPVSTDDYRPEVFHSQAFEIVSPREFDAREHIKLCAHNGVHLFIAVMARAKGLQYFSEARQDAEIMADAGRLLQDEISPALWKEYGRHVDEAYYRAYMDRLLGRLVSPTLKDAVARGVRGLADKFAPNERVVSVLRLLRRNGVDPRVFRKLIVQGLKMVEETEGRDRAQAVREAISHDRT